ncbi:sugar transferase, partial [Parabacteroides sp. 20_3]
MSAEKKKTTPLGKSEGEEPERFIPDGMGMFQRNVKRIGDCALAFLALIVFSPLFL